MKKIFLITFFCAFTTLLLAQKHNIVNASIALKNSNLSEAKQYIDEAHAFGVFGPEGQGLCFEFAQHIDFIVLTFGKALGGFGAAMVCDDSYKKFESFIHKNYVQ